MGILVVNWTGKACGWFLASRREAAGMSELKGFLHLDVHWVTFARQNWATELAPDRGVNVCVPVGPSTLVKGAQCERSVEESIS